MLGPVEIAWDGRPSTSGACKARALVARLLIDRDLIVSVDRLVDSLWARPRRAGGRDRAALDHLAAAQAPARGRRARGPHRDAGPGLRARGAGRGDRRLPARASWWRRAGASWPAGARASACGCSPRPRGSGAGRPTARCATSRSPGPRPAAWRSCSCRPPRRGSTPSLTLGRHEALVGELETLTSANPMRERLWSQRMLALYRCGPPGRGAAGLPGPARHPGGRAGDRAGARRDLDGARHPRPGPRARLPGPARSRRRSPTPGAAAAPSPAYQVRVPASQHEGPLVGRARESALLRDWWTSVREGAGRLLLVDGDPGIGKTRLVAELARAVEAEGALVLWGRCDEDPVAPFQPFAEALGRYFQSLSADRISRMPDWQLTELSRLVLRLREYAPVLEDEGGDPGERAVPLLRGGDGDAQRAVGQRHHPAGDRRPARGRPAHPAAAAPRAAGHRRRQRRHRRDVHRHRGAAGAPAARHAGRLPGGAPGGDGAPAGPEQRGGGGAGAGLAERAGGPRPPALPADRRQPALPRRAAAPARLPGGRAERGRRRARPAEPEPDRGHPGAGGPARLAAARGRDLPVAGGGRGGPRVRGGHRGRGGGAHRGTAARRLRPGARSRACSAASARTSATATPSATRSCATPSTASSCAGAGCATTTRSPSPPSGCTPTNWTPTSTSWPTTSTWVPPWPTPTRPSATAGPRASARSRLLAFEEAAVHFARSLEVAEQFGPPRPRGALRRARSRWRRRRTGRATPSWPTPTSSERPRWRGPWATPSAWPPPRCGRVRCSYLGIVRANEEQVQLLEEALAALPEAEDSPPARHGDGAARSRDRLRGRCPRARDPARARSR